MEHDLDDLLAQLDFIPDVGVPVDEGIALEELGNVPEIERLKSFIKDLEAEIAETRVISKNERKQSAVGSQITNDSDDEFMAMKEQESPVRPPFDATVNIDEFLEAIASSKKISKGGVSSAFKQAAMSMSIPAPVSPLQDADRLAYGQDDVIDFLSVDNFFSSAQDEDDQASSPRPHSKRSTPANRESVRKSFKFQEDFTVESLRRNWDKEEELSANIEKLTQKVLSPHHGHDANAYDADVANEARVHRSEVETLNQLVQNKEGVGKKRDERVKNDFLVCSVGEKLSNAFIFSEYVGLYPTEISHYNEQGKLVPSPIPTAHSTSNAKTRLMSSLSHFDPAHHAASAMMSNNPSSAAGSGSGNTSSSSYYNVHLLECILRPDIELKSIMAVIVQFSKQFCCRLRVVNRSHMVMIPLAGSGDVGAGRSMSADGRSRLDNSAEKVPFDKHEFDHLDIQICISKSIRQRVLLLQFARKVGSYGGLGFGSILLTHLSGPLENLTIKSCPETRGFMSRLRKELVAQEMSFSSLYSCSLVRVCALPQGLDSHFLAQLHSLCREQMWQKLDSEYKTMDEHLRQEEDEMAEFSKLMEPIYKQYNILLPPKDSLDGGGKDLNLSYDPASDKPVALLSPRKRISSVEDGGTADQESDDYRIDEAKVPMSPGGRKDHIMDTMHRKQYRVDGMTFCLIMLDQVYQELQSSCDDEYGVRLQKKHNATVAATQEKVLYKNILLTNLFNSPDSRSSPFHQSFVQLFSQVPVATAVSLPIPTHNALGAVAEASSSQTVSGSASGTSGVGKSWLGDWGSTVQQLSTACFSNLQGQSKMIADKAGGGSAGNESGGGLFGSFFGASPTNANATVSSAKEPSVVSLHTSSSDNFQLVDVRDDSTAKEAAISIASDTGSGRMKKNETGTISKSVLGGDGDYEQVDKSCVDQSDDTASFPVKLPRSLLLFYCACLVSIVRRKPLADGAVRKEIAYDRLVASMQSATCYISPYYCCIAISNSLLVGLVNNSIQLINSNMSSLMSSMAHKSKEVYSMTDFDSVCMHRTGTSGKSRSNSVSGNIDQGAIASRRPSAAGETGSDSSSGKVATAAAGGNTVSHRVVSAHGILKIKFFGGLKEVYLTPIMMDSSKLEMVIKEVHGAFSTS